MESKHTKGIWKVTETHDGIFQIDSDKNNSAYAIATVVQGKIFPSKRQKDEVIANAEIICKSVNAHDELVKALKEADIVFEYINKYIPTAYDPKAHKTIKNSLKIASEK